MRRYALRLLCLFFLLQSWAWGGGTAILVVNDTSGSYRQFSDGFAAATGDNAAWRLLATVAADRLDTAPKADVIVTAGAEAFRQALQRGGSQPVIASMLSRQNYEKLLAEAGRGRRTSAVFIDQSPARQVTFLRALLPGRERIGMLASPSSRAVVGQFRQALAAGGMGLEFEECDSDASLLAALNAVLPRSQVLLALPDPAVFKRENIKAILMTSYRYQKPVVAFSSSFVHAGAYAALFSTPEQMGLQAAEMLQANGSNLPPPEHPQAYSIAVNPSVAAALGLEVPDEGAIRRLIAAREGR